jgi:hypothetical protein
LGDDRVIVGRDRRARGFPKPVTAGREMLPEGARTLRSALALRAQRLLYSRPVRRLGLFLGERRLPAATLNTYLQRFIPQPKFPLAALADGVVYGDEAGPGHLVVLDKGDAALAAWPLEKVVDYLLDAGDEVFGFHPYPLLSVELSRWNGRDWIEEERDILRAGLAGCQTLYWRQSGDRWWEQITGVIRERNLVDRKAPAAMSLKSV